MRPRERQETGEQDLFRSRLDRDSAFRVRAPSNCARFQAGTEMSAAISCPYWKLPRQGCYLTVVERQTLIGMSES